MKILRDFGVVLLAAVVTAAGAGLVLRPATADAEDAPTVTNTIDGVHAVATLDKAKYEKGEKPVVTLVATNPGKEAVSREMTVNVMAQPVDEISRSLPIPTVAWTRSVTVKLEPGESKTVTLKTDVQVLPMNHYSPFVLAAAPAPAPKEEVAQEEEKPAKQPVSQR